MQAAAERALSDGLTALGANAAELDGAVVVTSPHTGEVRALVGGREPASTASTARSTRAGQIGSLIKPAVYLAALESGNYTLASVVDDSPIDVKLDNGDVWSPHDFDERDARPVPLVRALAESLNLATVRLGLDVGLEPIADVLGRLGLEQKPKLYPSMLLGALALTPLEVAQIYNTLANGGFRVPLRAVRSVIDEDGTVLSALSDRDRAGGRSRRRLPAEPSARAGHGARHGQDRARAAARRSHGRRQNRHLRRLAR